MYKIYENIATVIKKKRERECRMCVGLSLMPSEVQQVYGSKADVTRKI